VPAANPNPYPPDIEQYLAWIKPTIGAESDWQMTNIDVYDHFAARGDWMHNFGTVLERVIDAGVGPLSLVCVTLLLTRQPMAHDYPASGWHPTLLSLSDATTILAS
jgi:hypothetical protein